MKPKQVIEQLQEIKQEIQEELDKWGEWNLTKENGADPIPDIIDGQEKGIQAIDHAINCVGAIEQIKWERDIAIQQLNELGYQFGEKIRSEE